MSRAFVKEGDGEELDDSPPRPARVQPCYMTARGVAALRQELEVLQRGLTRSAPDTELALKADHRRIQRRVQEIGQILRDAVPVAIDHPRDACIRFGATVELCDDDGQHYTFQIVGEDETAPAAGKISWVSPLGRQLIGKAVGDEVVWRRSGGAMRMEVLAVDYLA
jgi:transcription elongation GreA/GreB family factor